MHEADAVVPRPPGWTTGAVHSVAPDGEVVKVTVPVGVTTGEEVPTVAVSVPVLSLPKMTSAVGEVTEVREIAGVMVKAAVAVPADEEKLASPE